MSPVHACRPLSMCCLSLAVSFTISCVMLTTPARADTIYLKNGAFIDGMVGYRSATFLELEIGDIGKLHIPLEDIFVIEKNSRTGDKLAQAYVDPEGEREVLPAANEARESGDPKDEEEPADEEEAEAPSPSSRKQAESEGDGDDLDVLSQLVEEEDIDPKLEKRIKELVKDLEREKPRFRVRAERHLKTIGSPTIPYLVPLVKSDNDLTRIAVMRLFLAFGDDRVVDGCIDSLTDVNEYVRDYANKTLKRVTGEDFGFLPYASPRKRELVRKKWAKWWKKELEDLAKNYRSSRGGNN